MSFPTGDMLAALSRHMHFQSLEQALCERHPELTGRVQLADSRGRPFLRVAVSGKQSVGLLRSRMGHADIWLIVDPVLDSDPSVWPVTTPDGVLVDALHAVASAHLAGEPVASPWRWSENRSSQGGVLRLRWVRSGR
ncbi:hypothetical protein ACFY2M_44965 [Streptomyces sp. NPDC001276]|uniref:hypothetical protein n=1 Tax=Streptomyces sp. NPDC001276 TaxID=3364555 RepID=UPI003681C70B